MNKNMLWKLMTYFFALCLLLTLTSFSNAQSSDSETMHNAFSAHIKDGKVKNKGIVSESCLQAEKALDDGSRLLLAASSGANRVVGKVRDTAELPASANAKPARAAAHSDRDGNGLSDGLQAKLANILPADLVDVVVTFSGPGNAVSAQHAVGPFHVKREFRIIPGFSAKMTAAQVMALAKTPGVFRVEEDFKVFATLNAANHDFGTESARTEFGLDGSGIGICVVDTGVDPSHEQLDGGKIVGFYDQVNGQTSAYDDNGHGTHVSSIAAGDGTGSGNAAAFKGVAPGASIYAAKVLSASGSGPESNVIAGIQWCAGIANVNIISMSLASEGSSDGDDALSQAVDNAVADGKIVVVAAGNGGAAPYTIGSPGASQQAITVGAVAEWSAPKDDPNHSDGIYLAPFSSRGPTADDRIKPDIVAPGVSITAAQAGTVSGYAIYSGTSMATPFVSGTVALALEGVSDLTPADVKNMLKSTAQGRGLENDWGTGLIDGYAFVAQAQTQTITGPTPFPTYQTISGTVSDFGVWTWPFAITEEDLNIPIGITITIEGEPACSFGVPPDWCFWWEWSPDLEAKLIDPNNNTVATSTCPLTGDCESMGRQETLHIMPAVAGTYTVKIYPCSESPNNGKGGSFLLDVSTGPLSGVGEICNDGVDNDTDGYTDCEDSDCNSNSWCIDSDGDGWEPFRGDCDDTDNAIYPGATEICDSKDNDCDNATVDGADETWFGTACDGNDLDLCQEGVYECVAGIQQCNDSTDNNLETCDNIDNDCDGSVDEGLTRATTCGVGECASTGEEICIAGVWSDDTCLAGSPSTELCNDGLDNDCDGNTDCDDIDCNGDPACQVVCDHDGICEQGENCSSCPNDCIGKSTGKPSSRYCCGDGTCEGAEDSENCSVDCGPPPICGDGTCDSSEDQCNCSVDCGHPDSSETSCTNNIDDDCDGYIDCEDSDCDSAPNCTCLPRKAACTQDSDCCSNRCFRNFCK